MSFSRSDVSAKKHMARISDFYRERFRSIKTVLFFIVSVSLLSGEAVPTPTLLGNNPLTRQTHRTFNCSRANLNGPVRNTFIVFC